MSPTQAFITAAPLPARSRHNASSTAFKQTTWPRSTATSTLQCNARRAANITKVSADQLENLVSTNESKGEVVVLKCYASYCRSCKGVEPKYRKIAAAYQDESGDDRVRFVEMDYAKHEQFCREQLGVTSLPFFGIWRDGRYIGGEAMSWTSVGKKLVQNIDNVVAGVDSSTLKPVPT